MKQTEMENCQKMSSPGFTKGQRMSYRKSSLTNL